MYLAQGSAVFLTCLPPEESLAIMAGAVALLSPEMGPEYALSMGADEDGIAYWAEFILEHSRRRSEKDGLIWRMLSSKPLPMHFWNGRIGCTPLPIVQPC